MRVWAVISTAIAAATAVAPAAPQLDRPQLVAWRDSQIVRAGADGGRVRVLVGGRGVFATLFERAAWSPDGRRLAFTGQRGRVGDFDRDIYVMRADGSERRRLTSDGISFHPVWSPNGQRIYFARKPRRHPDEITLRDGSLEVPAWIWSMRPDGSDQRAVTSPVRGRYEMPESFSPDGATLAFTRGTYVELDEHGRERNTRDVWVMRPDGSDARKLADRSEDPVFSPDGRLIAFASDRDQNGSLSYGDKAFFANELYVMGAHGAHPRRLTRTRAVNELQPSWLPSGTRIAYQRGKQFQNAEFTSVMQTNADGSCPRRIFAGRPRGPWYAAPAWRPGNARTGDRALRCR
jgi:Tol biopolymer transport system component